MRLPEDGEEINAARSHGGRDIILRRFGSGELKVLLLGGVHGDESEGFFIVEKFIEAFEKNELSPPAGISLYVCPRVNPDGCAVLRRTNERNVDLNRNLPTKDWNGEFRNVRYYPGSSAGSESESAFTMELIEELKPAVIFSMHSYENAMINFNGDCEDLAQAMSVHNGLPPRGDIGYPTPGSLGTYSGWERGIPTITLEIFRGQPENEIWEKHREGLLAGFSYYRDHPLPEKK